MLTLDYANCLSSRVGEHGLDPARLDRGSDFAKAAAHLTERLATTRGTGWEKWRDLATGPARAQYTKAVRKVVAECEGKFDNLVVLGIGGSALGNIALQSALNPASYNLLPANQRPTPRLFVVDNVDPASLGSVLDTCRQLGGLERTCFNVISKSGETAETASQFMIVRAMLKETLGKDFHRNIVAIT
ncbi:Glucose-6-phosphate isomerase, partial [hydrothermal vent metagenome]